MVLWGRRCGVNMSNWHAYHYSFTLSVPLQQLMEESGLALAEANRKAWLVWHLGFRRYVSYQTSMVPYKHPFKTISSPSCMNPTTDVKKARKSNK